MSDSPAYDGPELTTGEPIFLKVVDEVVVEYSYEFGSEAEHDVTLEGDLLARLTAGNGLKRTVSLETRSTETNDSLILSAPIVLDELQRLVRAVEKETGVDQSSYAFTVAAQVDVHGTVGGAPLDESFDSEMELRLDGLQLAAPVTAEGTFAKDTLATATTASVEQDERRPNDLVVGPRQIGMSTLQRIAWGAAAAAFLVLAAALLVLFLSPRDDANRIHAKYGGLIVPIKEAPRAEMDTVDVPDIDTLVRLAQQFEQVILHEASLDRHTYVVSHDGFLYRYSLKTQARAKVAAR